MSNSKPMSLKPSLKVKVNSIDDEDIATVIMIRDNSEEAVIRILNRDNLLQYVYDNFSSFFAAGEKSI